MPALPIVRKKANEYYEYSSKTKFRQTKFRQTKFCQTKFGALSSKWAYTIVRDSPLGNYGSFRMLASTHRQISWWWNKVYSAKGEGI